MATEFPMIPGVPITIVHLDMTKMANHRKVRIVGSFFSTLYGVIWGR